MMTEVVPEASTVDASAVSTAQTSSSPRGRFENRKHALACKQAAEWAQPGYGDNIALNKAVNQIQEQLRMAKFHRKLIGKLIDRFEDNLHNVDFLGVDVLETDLFEDGDHPEDVLAGIIQSNYQAEWPEDERTTGILQLAAVVQAFSICENRIWRLKKARKYLIPLTSNN